VIRLPEKRDDSDAQGISLDEKLRILREEENYSPPRPRRRYSALVSLEQNRLRMQSKS
jgi:hypothetical protein